MAYLGKSPSQGVRNRYYFTASGGETSISGALTGGTLTFTDGNYVDVNLNGVTLVAGTDYNTSTANTIAGLSALTASDVVEIVVYDVFSVFSGNVNSDFSVGGNLSVTGTTAFTGATTITGLTTTGDINFGDNDKAQFGAGNDLQIYHDSSNSYVKDAGTGDLLVQGTQIKLQDASGNDYLRGFTGGAVYLHHAGNTKFETTSTGVSVTGGFTASDGCTITTADNDPQLTLVSTDADANEGPILKFHRNSASPADNDLIGQLLFHGEDGAGNDQQYANIQSIIMNNAQGNEDGRLTFRTLKAGTATSRLDISNAETVFNDSSVDVDFRVESLGDANSFVVEGATKGIGMGTNDPTIDSSLAGVSVPGGSRVLHIHDGDCAYLKLSDPATGGNRGAQLALINTTAILNNCESGNLLIGQGNTEVARFHQGGVVGIGTTTANYTTTQGFVVVPTSNGYIANGHASGTANGTSYQLFSLAGTAIGSVSQASSSSVAFNTTSDYRRKTAVSYDWDATTRLKQLKPCRFKWISEGETAPFVDGFLAHEVSDTVPEAITGEKDAMKDEEYVVTEAKGDIYTPATDDADEVIHSSDVERPISLADGRAWRETAPQVTATRNVPDYQQIDQSKLVPLLVKTIQELEARIAALEAE